MIKQIKLILILLVTSGFYATGQQAENINFDAKSNSEIKSTCADQFAGNVTLGEVVAQSEAVSLPGPIFLCYEDRFTVLNSNADLTGDPIPGTPAGIGYAFYECDPAPANITGNTLADIEADPCVLDTPNPDTGNDPDIADFWVYTDEIDGTALFQNSNQLGGQTIPEFFNGGAPVQLYFAPMTFDNFYSNNQETGNCVNVNVQDAFPVVYLNEITISNCIVEESGGGLFTGTFTIEGGLSEFNGSTYSTVAVVRSGNFNNQAEIIGGPFIHGDEVTFTTDIEGDYTILIQDGVSCGAAKDLIVQENLKTLTVEAIPQTTGPYTPGTFICVDYIVSGFDSLSFTSWTMNFDPNVLEFTNVVANPTVPSLSTSSYVTTLVDDGLLLFSWFQSAATGFTLPDGSIFFEVCFNVIGEPGDCSPLFIDNSPTQISISGPGPDGFGEQYDFEHIDTELCVIEGDEPEIFASTCSANGSDDGSITFYITGGTAPYSYVSTCFAGGNINSSLTEVTIPDLIAGNCTITVTDASGASDEILVNITDDPPLSITTESIDPLCYGFPNGKIRVTDITGGTPEYNITWSDGTQVADTIHNLAEGIYSVTIEDSRGCEVEQSFAIGVDPIMVQFNIVDTTTCEELEDGVMQAIASGGTPINGNRYNYQWNNPNLSDFSVISSFNTGIPTGTGLVLISDANNCSITAEYEMAFKKEVTVDLALPEIDCFGDQGEIIATAGTTNNSCSTFSFAWNAGIVSATTANINTTEPVEGGDLFLTITDCDGCELDTLISIEIPEEITAPTIIEFDCDQPTGSIIVFPSGTQNGFDIAWSDDPNENSTSRTDLAAGTYIFTITDGNDCMKIDSAVLEQNIGIQPDTFFVTGIDCAGDMDGTITVDVLGQGNYDFAWEGPDGAIADMDETITGLGAGVYTVTVSDDQGCIAVDSTEIVAPDSILVTPNFSLPSCNGETDGSISLEVTGGTPDYIYDWEDSPANETEVLPAIGPGMYSVTVSDQDGCSVEQVLELEDQVVIDIQLNILQDILCSGDSTGIVEVVMSGGPSDNGIYGTIFSNGEGNTLQANVTDTAFLIPAGMNQVIVFDALCADTLDFELVEPEAIAINASLSEITDASCFGLCDGEVTLFTEGGTGDFDYVWEESGNIGETEIGLCFGWQLVEITDDNGCIQIDSVFINQPDTLIATVDLFSTFSPSCNEDSEGQITVDYTGGNIGPVTYIWTDDVSDDEVAMNLPNGTYEVTITDMMGCTDSISYTIQSSPPIVAELPSPEEIICFGDQTCITVGDLVSGGSGSGYRFQINNSFLFPVDSCVNVFAGEYDISVVDSEGCSFDTTIFINQPSELLASLGDDIEVSLGDSLAFLEVQLNQTFAIDSIFWLGDFPFLCLDPDCQRIQIFPTSDGSFNVVAISEDGCVAEDDINIFIDDERKVYFPNTFTPNSDGINDRFQLFTGIGVEEILVLQVYDRWGNKMYDESNLEPNPGGVGGWDGSFNGQQVDPGVYVYRAEISFIDGRVIPYSGTITLLK